MASSAEIQAQIDALNNKISTLSSGMGGAGVRTTYQNQIRNLQTQLNAARQAEAQQPQQQQQQQPQQQQEQPQQQTTPISEVAPQAAGNQLPTLKQSIIDEQFKNKRTNELTSFNSDIRDKIVDAGWNEKSDAVRILNGSGVYGIVAGPAGMGSIGYKKLNGSAAGEQDFIDAAKAAGIDPNQYMNSETIYGKTSKTLDQTKLYNALQEKGKDLYSVTNSLSGAGGRGDATPHATVLYKADGSGNLVVQNDPTTGQPDVKYFEAVRYAKPESFMDTYGPFLALAPAFGGILQSAGVIPTFGSATGTAAGSGAFPAGAGGYGSIGPAGFTASTAAPTLSSIAAGLPTPPISSGGGFVGGGYGSVGTGGFTAADAIAALPANQVQALTSGMTAAEIAALGVPNDVIGAGSGAIGSFLGSKAGGAAANALLEKAFGNSGLFNALGAGGQAVGSYLSGQAQADAAKEAARNQMTMFNTINQQFAPQRGAGYQSLNQIRSMLPGQSMTYNEAGQPSGVQTGTDYLTRQFSPQDLQAGLAPNYQFMLGQGQQAQQRAANVGGGLIGGNAMRGLQDYTQNYAQNAYQNAFQNFNTQRTGIYNTLAGIAGLGQQAQNTTAQAGQAATTAQGQLGIGAAAAQAAGLTGAANAAQGGLQNYQQNQILQAVLGQNQNVAQTQTPGYFE
jgi:hypothetical protein